MDQMDRLTNPMVDCAETIKHLDLEAWKEKGPVDKTCEVDVSSFYLYSVRLFDITFKILGVLQNT